MTDNEKRAQETRSERERSVSRQPNSSKMRNLAYTQAPSRKSTAQGDRFSESRSATNASSRGESSRTQNESRPGQTRTGSQSRSHGAPIRTPKRRKRITELFAGVGAFFARIGKKRKSPYKSGALARTARPVRTEASRAPLVITLCVLGTVLFSLILGNILGAIAENAQNTTTNPSSPSTDFTPSVDKVSPTLKLNAYFADMSGASPENSLSDQTSAAREAGNALFFELRYSDGDLLYTSDTADELEYPSRDNLTLTRLYNHFQYYNDYAVGIFVSDYLPSLSAQKRLEVKSREIALMAEAADNGFDQIIVEFADKIDRDSLAYYQSYLIDLKLACPKTPIGIRMSLTYLSDADNSGTAAQLLSLTDFFVLDLGSLGANEIDSVLSPLVYYIERYDGTVLLAKNGDEPLSDRIAVVEKKKIDNYIVK